MNKVLGFMVYCLYELNYRTVDLIVDMLYGLYNLGLLSGDATIRIAMLVGKFFNVMVVATDSDNNEIVEKSLKE